MQLISPEQIERFKAFLESHKVFIIAGHKEPDGDCVSSCIGLSYIVEKTGKPFTMINAGPFKRNEIKGFSPLFKSTLPFMTQDERNSCGLLIADCSELSRIGDIDGDLKGLDSFIIDHHKTSQIETEDCIIDSTAPAASCIVQFLFESLYGKPSKEEAETFFFGMATDTGYFRFLSENSAEVFRGTARLVEAGVDPRKMYQKITDGKQWSTRKLLGVMLEHAERHSGGRIVSTYETIEDTRRYGQEGRDSDAFYSLMLEVENVEAVIFIRQETEFSCTIGLRSKEKCDVSSVATKFGGGGHKNAAGASTEGKIETLLPLLIKELSKVI